MKHFRVSGSTCYILKGREDLGKFDARSNYGIFLGYALNSRVYKVYNLRTSTIMESINVVVHDSSIDVAHESRDNEVFEKPRCSWNQRGQYICWEINGRSPVGSS